MHARLRRSKSLFTLYQIINKPDIPSLADGIAEPHLDMNIKVAAFTVSEKSSNTQTELTTMADYEATGISVLIMTMVNLTLLKYKDYHLI